MAEFSVTVMLARWVEVGADVVGIGGGWVGLRQHSRRVLNMNQRPKVAAGASQPDKWTSHGLNRDENHSDFVNLSVN